LAKRDVSLDLDFVEDVMEGVVGLVRGVEE
jgi:hypothetical protein